LLPSWSQNTTSRSHIVRYAWNDNITASCTVSQKHAEFSTSTFLFSTSRHKGIAIIIPWKPIANWRQDSIVAQWEALYVRTKPIKITNAGNITQILLTWDHKTLTMNEGKMLNQETLNGSIYSNWQVRKCIIIN
jgi:hypothetical protein